MTMIRVPYGETEQRLAVEDHRLNVMLVPRHAQSGGEDQSSLVQKALEHPIVSPRLCELAKDKGKILVITSDHTRPVPSRITMPLFLEEIRQGSPDADIRIPIATGMHRPTTEAELRAKMGDEIVNKETVVIHKAEKDGDMHCFGVLPSGGGNCG